MKTLKIFALVCSLLWFNSCKDFDELQNDPNRTTLAHPSLILTNLEISTFGNTENGNNISVGAALASRMMVFTDDSDDNQYYTWQRSSFNRYNQLRQVVKMNEEADRVELPNYKALGLFFQSVIILEITKVFGDVPYSESLAGTSQSPKYDLQSDIYLKVLNDLDAANTSLSEANGAIDGDIIYGGDIKSWKRLINSYTLRVLISLSKHSENTALQVKTRFSKIVNDPVKYPIMTSNDHNGDLPFVDQSTATSTLLGNRYPFYNNNSFKTAYYMDESFVNLLKDFEDPRLFVMADKKPQGGALPADDPDAYGGLDGSAPLATNITRLVNGEASKVNPRYYSNPVNEPSVLMGYAEVEFTLAEAAELDWTTGDAEEHYLNGIEASMGFYGVSSDYDDYILEAGIAYVPATGIEQIITQKYINFFLQGGWEAFYNHERTGFPLFKVDGGAVQNGGVVPKRWMYPNDEFTLNLPSVQAAVARQYPAGDNINGVMWLWQND